MRIKLNRRFTICAAVCAATGVLGFSGGAQALGFTVPAGKDMVIDGVLNTTITVGGAWRMHAPSADLIGKADLNPQVCGRRGGGNGPALYQSCQGLFRDQALPADHLAKAPGQFSMNADDGNLNYGRGAPVSGIAKITQDISLKYGDFGFFGKTLFFYDWVNNNFTENHPNYITKDNYTRVGVVSSLANDAPTPRSDSIDCGTRNPTGAGPCGIVYGAGEQVYSKRRDGETLKQIGTDLQLLDAYFYGKVALPFGEKQLTFKIGRQSVNWGESTLLAFGAINQANPINANNVFRVGSLVEEFFTPINMVFLSTEPFAGATLEAFYQLEWKPLEIPAYGSFLSPADIGSNNGGNKFFNLSFGGAADDPDLNPQEKAAGPNGEFMVRGGYAVLQDNPLSGLTNTSLRAERLPDYEPGSSGQFGIALKYYAEALNNGTELGFFFENYHARIPNVSVYSAVDSCAINSKGTAQFLLRDCPDQPVLHQLVKQNDPYGATNNSIPFDTIKFQLEYPRNIQLLGVSFNTTVGDISAQGEVAFRPREPLQVSLIDLAFAGFGPTLGHCHLEPGTRGAVGPACDGTNRGSGVGNDGTPNFLYGPSDYINGDGSPGSYKDTFDLLVGAGVGSGRAFPSYVVPYRGGVVGTNPGSIPTAGYNHSNPGYIRGYEYFKTFQFNLGGTYILGATDNSIGADQVILLFETGATWVPGLPSYDQLQLEAPGLYTHASAGADGTGFVFRNNPSQHPGIQPDGSFQQCDAAHPCVAVGSQRQACSSLDDCSYGVDGLRFNPHQQDPQFFPDKISGGYDIIALIRYESLLPGISVENQIIFKHDVFGTAPGIATNFIEGRKMADLKIETRYKSALAFDIGYTWFFGGGPANLNRDRDVFRTYVKYQF